MVCFIVNHNNNLSNLKIVFLIELCLAFFVFAHFDGEIFSDTVEEFEKKFEPTNGNNFLGRGGYGKVISGTLKTNQNFLSSTNKDCEHRVACKYIKKIASEASPGKPSARQRRFVENEFKCAQVACGTNGDPESSISHPNIAKVYGTCEISDDYCMLMEELSGGDLEKYINEKRSSSDLRKTTISDETASQIMYHIVSGMKALHEKGVVHVDMKPPNLMFSSVKQKPEDIKIIDFGGSRLVDSVDSRIDTLDTYTAECAAPEILRFEDHCKKEGQFFTAKADVWSLGLIAYELFFGMSSNPFRAVTDFKKTLNKQNSWVSELDCSERRRVNPSFSENACNFIKKCFSLNAEARPSTEELLKNDPWIQDGYQLYKKADEHDKMIEWIKEQRNTMDINCTNKVRNTPAYWYEGSIIEDESFMSDIQGADPEAAGAPQGLGEHSSQAVEEIALGKECGTEDAKDKECAAGLECDTNKNTCEWPKAAVIH